MPKKTKILFTSSGIVYNKLENKEVYKQNKIFIEKIFQTLGNYGTMFQLLDYLPL